MKGEEPSKSKRRMSFSSAAVAMGPFPESVKLADPVIHVLISFENIDECPKEEDIYVLVERLMEVDRMKGIPKVTKPSFCRGSKWTFEQSSRQIDPKLMIRSIDVHCDTIDEMADVVGNLSGSGTNGTVQPTALRCNGDVQPTALRCETRNLPWWEFCLIRNTGTSESMLVLRIDHTIGDGLAISRLCSKIMTREDGTYLKTLIPESMMKNKKEHKENMRMKLNFGMMGSTLRLIPKFIGAIFTVVMQALTRFDHGTAFAKNVIGNKKDTHNRKIIIFDKFPLSYVKSIQKKANVTFNDVILGVLSQSIHDFCKHSDCQVMEKHGKKIRCTASMPYGFPSAMNVDINDVVHNGWVPLPIDLGVGYLDPKARLQHINKHSTKLKKSPLAMCQNSFVNYILPLLPVFLYRKIVQNVYSRQTLTSTNMPGPDHRILVASKTVSSCRFTLRHIHPVVAILSYNGQVGITLNADDVAIPDVHLLSKFYKKALIRFGNEYGVEVPSSMNKDDSLA